MSHYQELMESLHQAQNELKEYEKECRQFARALVDGYKIFLESPEDSITCHPPSLGYMSTPHQPEDALELASDTFWHFVVAVHLVNNGDPLSPVIVQNFMIKKEDGYFLAKLAEYDELFRFESAEAKFDDFYQTIFTKKKNEIRKSFQDFLSGKHEELPDYLAEYEMY
ncbi:MAG: hypothetical protein GF372_01105 [Candidatus Marinimicrobia bacterium]|nr:hypothetical protein [Candidatus Neomarinimicrobiota bacterium]